MLTTEELRILYAALLEVPMPAKVSVPILKKLDLMRQELEQQAGEQTAQQ